MYRIIFIKKYKGLHKSGVINFTNYFLLTICNFKMAIYFSQKCFS